jgi:hypothetical protein
MVIGRDMGRSFVLHPVRAFYAMAAYVTTGL